MLLSRTSKIGKSLRMESPLEATAATAGEFVSCALWRKATDETSDRAAAVVRIALTVFVAGYFVMFNNWWHIPCLGIAFVIAMARGAGRTIAFGIQSDKLLRFSAHFLVWMTARSLLAGPIVNDQDYSEQAGWLLGGLGLAGFGGLVWFAGSEPRRLANCGLWVGAAGAFAAVLSGILFYFVLPGHGIGERLMNCLVYGGLNPVCTGLTFGFAAMWLACLRERATDPRSKCWITLALVVLLLAVLFTRSRGGILALICGHLALVGTIGIRRSWVPCMIFAALVFLFQISGPAVADLALIQKKSRMLAAGVQSTPIEVGGEMPTENPISEMLGRKDSGRLAIYAASMRSLKTLPDLLVGLGQWGSDEVWTGQIGWSPEHLHSTFIATLTHGGIIGALILLGAVVIGFGRAIRVARDGEPTWLVLLIFGCVGLIFDGQTLTSLTSLPKFEPLLLWFPLLAAARGGSSA